MNHSAEILGLYLFGLFVFLGGMLLSGFVYSELISGFFYVLLFVHPIFLVIAGAIIVLLVRVWSDFPSIEEAEA